MAAAVRYTLLAIAGAGAGYLCLTVLANLEDWQFYTIRSLVTGRSVMSEIVDHPADRWIVPVLLSVFVTAGAVLGVLVARRFGPRRRVEEDFPGFSRGEGVSRRTP